MKEKKKVQKYKRNQENIHVTNRYFQENISFEVLEGKYYIPPTKT